MVCIKFCCVFWTLLLLLAATEANYHCGIRKHSFVQLIHHGWKVEEGQWPWHVAILHKVPSGTAYACGGSLVDRKHVLTAAHCVVKRGTNSSMATGDLLLHFGSNDLGTIAKHVQVRDVGKIHVHPDYSTHRNDIAVLELRLPVEFTDFVIPICLDMRVDKDLRSLEDQRGWITGWGRTQNGTVSSELQTASLPVVSYLQCFQNDRTLFGSLLNPTVFCAGDRNGTSPGTGDSGGGMYFSEGDRWVLRGIVSFGKIDESRMRVDTSKYTVFVNVQRYLSWIREVTEDQSLNSTKGGAAKRISEQECDRFKALAMKRSNGICSNARYPHTVSLVYPDGHEKCTGVLLNENHVLTACHCQSNTGNHPSMVRIGEYGTVNISTFLCHPSYKRPKRPHDLAIVRLATAVQLSYNTIPACLASNWTENLYDALMTSGYRHTSLSGARQFFESDANQIITEDECNRDVRILWVGEHIGSAQLCAINTDLLPASTLGSSGAPLQTVNTRTCMFTVVGVLSFGPGSLAKESQGTLLQVFSRVAHYLDWIEETVWGERAMMQQTTSRVLQQSTTENPSSHGKDFVFPSD